MTADSITKEELNQAYLALQELNKELNNALNEKDFDVINALVTERGPTISKLMNIHRVHPLAPDKAKEILDYEERLRHKMKEVQSELGTNLQQSQKHAHAKRMYDKFEK